MVFESFVVTLLNNYLGKYVRDLDTSNLRLGIWHGDAVLTELTLKDDVLDDLDLPIEVKSGYIGKLSLAIPWSNLYTKPVVVKIEDVFVVTTPITDHDFDAKQAEKRLRAAKRRKLHAIDKSNRHKSEEISKDSKLPDDYTFFEKLTAQIIKNVQIFIKNIHIRYEDKVTSPGSPFAVGITLKHLIAETTDEFWKPCVVEATVKNAFKFVSLDSLSVYWNTNIKSTQRYGGNDEWKSLLRSTITSKDAKNDDYEYEPFSVEAHVKIDQTPTVKIGEPKLAIEVVQRDLILGLSRTQFHNLMNLIESFELMLTNEPYRKYRPSVPLTRNAKVWWDYAYTAIVEEKIRTWSWTNIKRHRELYRKYQKFYKVKLIYDDKGIENAVLNSNVHDLEDQLDLSSILIAREHAQAEVNPGVLEESAETSSGWWGWIFGESENKKKDTEKDFDLSSSLSLAELSPTEKQRLFDALDYSENTKKADYPKEYVKYSLLFSMENFEVRLLNEIRRNIAYVSMTGVSGSLEHRPSSSNTSVRLEVNDVNVFGHSSNLAEPQPHLLALQKSHKDSDLTFFDFTFEIEPITISAEYAVYLNLEPVKIVHDTNTVMQIVNFFKMPQSRALHELTEVASSGLLELQNRTRVGLEFAVSQQTIVYFDVNLRSPCIVLPEYGAMERPGTVFVVDFGLLTIKSDLNSKHAVIQDATKSELENMLCDNFDVTLREMQILIADKDVDWEDAHAQSTSPYHLLPASEIDLEILRNRNVAYSSLPEIKLNGVLPSLDIKLSEEKYQQLMQFISNVPLLTEPLDNDERDAGFLTPYTQTLSRHSSRLSLEEVANIQSACREALTISPRDHEEFVDAEEQAQDADDEEEWFLASDALSKEIKKSDIGEIPSIRTPEKMITNKPLTVSGEFSIKKVSIVFNKFIESVDQPYVNLVISDLGAQVSLLEWEMKIGAKLGSIYLIDYLFKDIDGSPLTVLSSVAENDLISFSYKKVKADCPYPNPTCEGVDCFMKTEFNALNVLLHREGIVSFQNFILALVERSEKPNLRKLGQRVSSYLELIPEEAPVEIAYMNKKENEAVIKDSGKTKAEAELGEVLVTLSANDKYFALLKINGLHLDALVEERQTHIKASLEHFDIEDLKKDTLYEKILTVQDDNLCDVEVTFYSKDKEIQSNTPNVDMDVLFNFGRLKFVFLHHFLSSLQDFFSSFASAETRQYAHEATSQVVQIQVETLRESAPKIGLKVDINAPVIKLPVDARSKNGVIVDLGHLQVKNKLQYHITGSKCVLTDVMYIQLDSFQVIRSNVASSWTGTHNLIDPTGLNITLTRCLKQGCTTVPAADVEAVLAQLTVSIDEKDFRLLMKTWGRNVQHALTETISGSETDGAAPLDDDISYMPEVEQHELEKTDGRQPNNSQPCSDNDKRMKLNAVIDNVSLQFPTCINGERLPYLEMNIHQLKAAMEFSESTTQGSACLGGLFLFDHRYKASNSSNPLPVLESSRDKNLISVQYNKGISEGQSSSVTQTLEILSTVIKLHFEEQSILGIQQLATSFIESSKLSGSRLSLVSANESKTTPPKAKESETEAIEIKKTDNFKLTVNMTKVDLTLSRKNVKIVRVVLEDVFTEIIADDEKFVIYSRQKGLSVTDLDPLSFFPNVITIEGKKLFDFEYQSLPPTTNNDHSTSLTAPHSLLSLDIGKIRIVFLYKLIAEIQAFLQALVSPETTTYSYELAQRTVQDQFQTIEKQGIRIALKVDIKAPIVFFPSHSQSVDCLVADLGHLHAVNTFTTCNHPRDVTQIVLVDKIDVALQSVQLSRGTLNTNSGAIARRLLIQPVKMSMVVSRSMQANAHWLPYLNIEMELEHIEMNMDEADYQLLISAMQQNYAEAGAGAFNGATVFADDVFVSETSATNDIDIPDNLTSAETGEKAEETWKELVIDFAFSGLSLTLYNNEDVTELTENALPHHNTLATLCSCKLHESCGTLVTHNDLSIDLLLFLYGCIIEDARPSKMTAFPRMLSHRTEQDHGRRRTNSKNAKMERPSMIKVLYKQTPTGEMKVNLTLQDPTLHISFPLLWSLLDFFTVPPVEGTAFPTSDAPLSQSTRKDASSSAPYVLEVKGNLNNPEIVLLGEPENPNSSALIIQTTIDFTYKLVDNHETFSTLSKELVVHSCRYPEREETLYRVVKPCAIDFQYSYPGNDCEGQEINLCVPDMKVKVSPLLLKTLLAISNSFYGEQEITDDSASLQTPKVEDTEELWRPQPICKEDWIKENSQGRLPSRIHLNTTVTEKFSMEIKAVRVTLYNEVMAHRIPLLLVNSNIVAHVKDWSSELKLETDVSVEAWYHNETLAAWEPLMESEETLSGRRHWQLQLKVFKANSHLLSFIPDSDEKKATDQEDFISLTTSPVFADTRHKLTGRHKRNLTQSFPPQYNTPRHHLEKDLRPFYSDLSLESRDSSTKSLKGIEMDEVDSGPCSPRSPISSGIWSEPAQDIPQATYIVLSSFDIMQLTVTRSAVNVLSDVAKVFTDVTSVSPIEAAVAESPFVIINELGVHTSVCVSNRHEANQKSTPDLTVSKRRRIDISDVPDCGPGLSQTNATRLQSLGELDTKQIAQADSRVSFELIKDDSDLPEHHSNEAALGHVHEDGPLDYDHDIPLAAMEKRFLRSHSMPARKMRRFIAANKEKYHEIPEIVAEERGDEIEEAVDPGRSVKESDSDVIDGPRVITRNPEQSKASKFPTRVVLENEIRELEENAKELAEEMEDGKKRNAEAENTKAETSFVSGAFAAMGLIAGISGHPVSSDKLVGGPEESRELLFERPQYKKADDYISIQIVGFDELSFVPVTRAGRFLYKLCPEKKGRFYYIVVQIEIKHGQKRVTIRAPLQVKNNLDIEIDLLESGARQISSGDTSKANDKKIHTVPAKGVVNIPLYSAHKGNLFIQPTSAGFKKSNLSVSWKDFSDSNRTTILTCHPKENGAKQTYCVKVFCEKDSLNKSPSMIAPHHILHLHPTMSFWNFLPCTVKLNLEGVDVSEMNIEPGKHHQITCVTTNKMSTFTLKVLEYMGTSWSGSFNVGGDSSRDVEIELTPEQALSNTLVIKLDYLDRGSLVVNLYSSYWIVNNTGLTISYKSTKSSNESFIQLASDVEPLLYYSPSKTKKIMLKLHGCGWSNSFSLDAVGNAGQLICKEIQTSREYEMAISIELSYNTLTKIITIMPKFVVINKTEHDISIREIGQKTKLWILIKANQCVPYWPRTKSNAFIVKLSNSTLTPTSKVLRINTLLPTIFRVGDGRLLVMSSEISESSTTIVFSPSLSTHLPKVENLCEDISISLHQKDTGSSTVVAPLTCVVYCWDEPGGNLTLLWQPENSRLQPIELPVNKDGFGEVNLDTPKKRKFSKKIRKTSSLFTSCGCVGRRSARAVSTGNEMNEPCDVDCVPRNTSERRVDKTIYWVSFLHDFQRVIVFTDDPLCFRDARKHCEGEAVSFEVFLSLDGVRLSVVNQAPSEIVYLGISSATSIWEVEKSPGKWKILNVETSSLLEEAWRNDVREHRLEKDVEVDFESMTMIKPYRGTLNRRYEPGLWVHYSSSTNYESVSAKVNRVQIDNQIFGTLFPCALYPSPLPAFIKQRYGFKPFCEISIIFRNIPRHNLLHLRYFKVLVQEMNVKLEKDFLLAIYKLLYGDSSEDYDEEILFQEQLRNISLTLEDTLIESGSLDTQKLFLEYFHLSPLKINLSISLQNNLYQHEKHRDKESDLFQFLVNSVGSPLTEVNEVEIKLACFERSGLFVTQGSLVTHARKHYTWQALRQFHAIVFGLDVLGNPYGLLTDLREGVKDLFYEPYQGIVLGPQEFASGLVRGVKSLLGHAVGGTAGAMSKITGTFGQAFASLSFDQDYRMKRRLRMRGGPTGIQEGVAMGGKSFLMGIVFGVTGVVTKPIQGAKADGVEGFFKGFGKGILGLVTRPTVGVFDMVSTTLDGIRRSAEQEGEDVVVRLRMPRFSPPLVPLQPYIEYQANGNGILKSLPRGNEIVNDVYIDHIPLPKHGHSSIALFTNKRVMEVYQNVFWSEWKIHLNVPYEDIVENASLINGAIQISVKNDGSEKMESKDQSTLQIVLKKLEEQLCHYRESK